MSAARRLAGAAVAVAATVAIAWLSRLPVTLAGPDEALLRLSWRMSAIDAEACRKRSPEELERLPVHMRSPVECSGGAASYDLRVRVDGREALRDTVHPAGARGDRPISLLRDLPLSPGVHDVQVRFEALLPEGVEPPDEGISSLTWRGELDIASRGVALVTLAPEGRVLEVRSRKDGTR